tara:strand:- start:42 stop:578 length:537 start_codon:yes stop_codon:yes gene_type:complete
MSSIIFAPQFSCKKLDENGFRTYTIKQGKHKSRSAIKFTKSNTLSFQVIFDESAQYTSNDPINQYDINKLYGLSDCGDLHGESSIRIGWRWLNDSLELHWFRHDGSFKFEKIKSVELNQIITCNIKFNDWEYEIDIDGTAVTIDRPCRRSRNVKYYLWPYFGGDETAPHDIKIKIKDL